MQNLKYQPMIIVGLGGSGVRTLRYFKSIAENNNDNDLKEALNRHIELVGIDLDETSNAEEAERISGLYSTESLTQEAIPKKLAQLGKNWLQLNPEDLNRALPKIWSGISNASSDDPCLAPYRAFRSWFPHNQVGAGKFWHKDYFQSTADTGGWRFKGRMAFFLNASRISNCLRAAIMRTRQSTQRTQSPYAIIVGSLAGGTGAGMFWDTAIMLKTIDPGIKVAGFFLLDAPFRSLGPAKTMSANVYAALKEILSQDDWYKKVQIQYPGTNEYNLGNVRLQGPPLDVVYVFQGFRQENMKHKEQLAPLESTCFRLAHVVRSFCRADLIKYMQSIGSHPWTFRSTQGDSGKALLSTAGSIWLPPVGANSLDDRLLQKTFDQLSASQPAVDKTDGPTILTELGLSPNQPNPLNQIIHQLKSKMSQSNDNDLTADRPANSDEPNPDAALPRTLKRLRQECTEIMNRCRTELPTAAKPSTSAVDLFTERDRLLNAPFTRNLADILVEAKKDKANGVRLPLKSENLIQYFKKESEQALIRFQSIADAIKSRHCQFEENTPSYLEEVILKLQRTRSSDNEQSELILKLKKFPVLFEIMDDFHRDNLPLPIRFLNQFAPDGHDNLRLKVLAQFAGSLKELPDSEFELDQESLDQLITTTIYAGKSQWIDALKHLNEHVTSQINRDKLYKSKKINAESYIKNRKAQLTRVKPISESITDLIRSFHNISSKNPSKWIENNTTEIGNRLATNFTASLDTNKISLKDFLLLSLPSGKQDQAENLEIGNYHSYVKNALVNLDNAVTQKIESLAHKSNAQEISTRFLNDFYKFICECIHPAFHKWSLDEALHNTKSDGEKLVKDYECIIIAATEQILLHFANQGLFLLLSGLRQEELEERLVAAQPRAFSDGSTPNPIKKVDILAMPFDTESLHNLTVQQKQELIDKIETAASRALNAGATIIQEETLRPMIFISDRYRYPEELDGIQSSFAAYREAAINQEHTLFHADRHWIHLPEIMCTVSSDPVHCGNDNCQLNLSTYSRELIICPKCKKPILNRCGNKDCKENSLYEYIQNHRQTNKNRIPFNCPACENTLRTYWWQCPKPGHHQKIPTDKESCPQCLREVQKGQRIPEDVGMRDDLSDTHTCPGCLVLRSSYSQGFKMPSEVEYFARNGVNGHDSVTFNQTMAQFSSQKGEKANQMCPNDDGISNHILIPCCPEYTDNENDLHFLYRVTETKFGCARHPHLRFWQCTRCDYPIISGKQTANCPRCFTSLYKCEYCSEVQSHYVQINAKYNGRCNHCLFPLSNQILPIELAEGIQPVDLAFCPNIYACNGGRHFRQVETDLKLRDCQACTTPKGRLIPQKHREFILDNCPLCQLTTGPWLPDKTSLLKTLSNQIIRFNEKSPEALNWPCKICGTKPIQSLWSLGTSIESTSGDTRLRDRLNELKEKTAAFSPFRFDWPPLETLQILHVLHRQGDDEEAFDELEHRLLWNEITDRHGRYFWSLALIFPHGSKVRKAIEQRLKALDNRTRKMNASKTTWNGS